MKSRYIATPENPYHLSVGALVYNTERKYLVHYFPEYKHLTDFYRLMKETMEEGESPLATLERGLREEFGASGKMKAFLGSKAFEDTWFSNINNPKTVQKTVIYFLVELQNLDETKRSQEDIEGKTDLRWVTAPELKENMLQKCNEYKIEEFDEVEIVERAESALNIGFAN